MSNQKREDMMNKLKKLFALAKSDNQHEAELAAQKASQIMEEYQIGLTELDMHEEGEILEEFYEVTGTYNRQWIYQLARACSILFNGMCIVGNPRPGQYMCFRFVGSKADLMAMKMTFEHLFKSWHSIVEIDLVSAKKHSLKTLGYTFKPKDTMEFKQGHGNGFASAINTRVRRIVEERKQKVETVSVTGRNLVLLKDAAIQKWGKDHGIKCFMSRPSSSGSNGGLSAGLSAGNNIALNAIGGGESVKRIAKH